jgi:hypothetical protein
MKLAVIPCALALLAATAAHATDDIGEACTGTETLKIGTQPERTVPYALTFSADLTAGSYCYGKCGPDQTYPIASSASDPIKLADLDKGGQVRHITFDRRSSVLIDEQRYDAGLIGPIVRNASAVCKAAPFHEPARLPKAGA